MVFLFVEEPRAATVLDIYIIGCSRELETTTV